MIRHSKMQEEVSDSTGLLISILVRYPEVASINFDPVNQSLKFTFIFEHTLRKRELADFEEDLLESIRAYNYLEKNKMGRVSLSYQVLDNYTAMEILRDVENIMHGEIALIVDVFRDSFKGLLVTESNSDLVEEDLTVQEELIEHMLENIKESHDDKSLFAFRDEGKVLVFNK